MHSTREQILWGPEDWKNGERRGTSFLRGFVVARPRPCVVYLHGNCSSRCEAVQCLPVLLPFGITVFCLDFAGSGMSDGEYISLGFHERDDLATVVDYLRASRKVTCIGLWGRSMGAATALLHADRDPSIAGLVLDSPFSDLRVLCQELVDTFTDGKVPHWLVGIALAAVRMSIQSEARSPQRTHSYQRASWLRRWTISSSPITQRSCTRLTRGTRIW
ncbi:unnamed protein product [Prorocentrum cordatum]|uniref:Serine aminopeptidase S33 domain-containing protein n=1 Tax=Prorocentrum cordatum TaxID=2364126 RepID=A0ABN9P6Y9_9DINO|nr:unnamed protein product [Polarella glacialis]